MKRGRATPALMERLSGFWPGMVCWLLVALVFSGCSNKKGSRTPSVPVTVAKAVIQPMPLSLNAVGVVEPLEAVSVKAQVSGTVTGVRFSEGQEVRAGQPLFEIDPRPFKVALDAAQAQLAKDKAQLANAETQAKRYADLIKNGFVTQEQYDDDVTQADMFRSTVQIDSAEVEQARLNLGYTSIPAPISGRTGSILVKRGNVVKANDASLVVINQMRPVRVSFSVPESKLPLVEKYASKGRLEVRVKPSEEGSGREETGHLAFLDNAVDPSSGTVALKAEISNEDGSLLPGQFVGTELILAIETDAITVPAGAVVNGQDGSFVFVVGPKNEVEKRSVDVDRTFNSTAVIERGLKPGETVVTDGQMRLVPGAKVTVRFGSR